MNRILSKVVEHESVVHTIERKSGVESYLDVAGEDVWIETAPEFDMARLMEHKAIFECMGFELIAEEPPVEQPNGNMRHYFEQRYFPGQVSLSVAG